VEGGGSVTGGFVYRGSNVPNLVGWYVFGDFIAIMASYTSSIMG